MRKIFLITILLSIVSVTYGGGPETAANSVNATATTSPPPPPNIFYCPPLSALHKNPDTHTWVATQGWQSYDISFVDKITQFAGAQWRGIHVGQISCVYRGESATDFPVLLVYKVIAYEPNGGKWSADLGGYKNCETLQQADCPFSIRIQNPSNDIYQQAEQLKRSAPKSSIPGF